jgi:hypothetical protein
MLMRQIPPRYVMLHHSATPDGQVFDYPALLRFHTSYRAGADIVTEAAWKALRQANPARGDLVAPWEDIGYHGLVENVNGTWAPILGRPWDCVAAACPQTNMNMVALHLCVVGNYDAVTPAEAALDLAARRFVKPWLRDYNIPPAHIVAHHDYNAAKTCPGRLFDMAAFRRRCA